jgi:hypothetical protein
VNKIINPFGKISLSGSSISDILYVFKIPYIQNYNNSVIYLLKKKQNEFKYTLYNKIIKDTILLGGYNADNFKKIYKNLEIEYLNDSYKIIAFSRLSKMIPTDGVRLNINLNNNLILKKIKKYKDVDIFIRKIDELLKLKIKNEINQYKISSISKIFNIKNLKN